LGNVTTNAYDSAGNLLSTTDALGNTTSQSYDSKGNLTSMTDASGKVIGTFVYANGANPTSMTDKNGVAAAKYSYDAWGVCTIISDISDCGIVQINPYRYRSYYYDSEIGMYYLQSRYYDPVVGRFINENIIIFSTNYNILHHNVFSYC